MTYKKVFKIGFLTLLLLSSLILNGGQFVYILYKHSFGWTVEPKYGVLKEDVHIGEFGEKNLILTLPKGLTVKDVSPTNQMGLFEPNRFSIIVSSNGELVDYSEDKNHKFGDLYSADIKK